MLYIAFYQYLYYNVSYVRFFLMCPFSPFINIEEELIMGFFTFVFVCLLFAAIFWLAGMFIGMTLVTPLGIVISLIQLLPYYKIARQPLDPDYGYYLWAKLYVLEWLALLFAEIVIIASASIIFGIVFA